jgi:hypothetical protein
VKARLQFAVALAMVGCIVAIVYSPFVDLPLTDTRASHSPVPVLHALPAAVFALAEAIQLAVVLPAAEISVPAADVVAITCSYLC